MAASRKHWISKKLAYFFHKTESICNSAIYLALFDNRYCFAINFSNRICAKKHHPQIRTNGQKKNRPKQAPILHMVWKAKKSLFHERGSFLLKSNNNILLLNRCFYLFFELWGGFLRNSTYRCISFWGCFYC